MKNKISNEYAEALFELALENEMADTYYEQMMTVRALFSDNMDYVELLSSPSVPTEEKLGIIDSAFEGRIDDNIVSFLKLLCERGRAGLFFACFEENLFKAFKLFFSLINFAFGGTYINLSNFCTVECTCVLDFE